MFWLLAPWQLINLRHRCASHTRLQWALVGWADCVRDQQDCHFERHWMATCHIASWQQWEAYQPQTTACKSQHCLGCWTLLQPNNIVICVIIILILWVNLTLLCCCHPEESMRHITIWPFFSSIVNKTNMLTLHCMLSLLCHIGNQIPEKYWTSNRNPKQATHHREESRDVFMQAHELSVAWCHVVPQLTWSSQEGQEICLGHLVGAISRRTPSFSFCHAAPRCWPGRQNSLRWVLPCHLVTWLGECDTWLEIPKSTKGGLRSCYVCALRLYRPPNIGQKEKHESTHFCFGCTPPKHQLCCIALPSAKCQTPEKKKLQIAQIKIQKNYEQKKYNTFGVNGQFPNTAVIIKSRTN